MSKKKEQRNLEKLVNEGGNIVIDLPNKSFLVIKKPKIKREEIKKSIKIKLKNVKSFYERRGIEIENTEKWNISDLVIVLSRSLFKAGFEEILVVPSNLKDSYLIRYIIMNGFSAFLVSIYSKQNKSFEPTTPLENYSEEFIKELVSSLLKGDCPIVIRP